MTITPDHVRPRLQRLVRRSLLIFATACLIAASLAAQVTESEFAADLSAKRSPHAGTCQQRCPLHRASHNDLANGWPQPLLPLGLLTLSVASVLSATHAPSPQKESA